MAPIIIYIANHSFESPVLPEGGYRVGVGPEWMEWTAEPSDFANGIQRPTTDLMAPVIDGAQTAFIHVGQIFQWTPEIVQGNARYTLEVDVYARIDVGPGVTWPGCEINLYTNKPAAQVAGSLAMVRVPAIGPGALSPGEMRTLTAVVDVAAHDILVGADVAVVVINLTDQPQLAIDNVRLTRDVVPTGIIPISNFSFERISVAQGHVSNDVQNWTIHSGDIGVFAPNVLTPLPGEEIIPTDGVQVLWMNSGVISQWLPTALVAVNTVYTLKVDIQAHPLLGDPGLAIQLLTNQQAPVELAILHHPPNSLAPGQGTTLTLTYTALEGDPALGQNIGIVFYSTGTPQILIDNVRLTYADALPPNSLVVNNFSFEIPALLSGGINSSPGSPDPVPGWTISGGESGGIYHPEAHNVTLAYVHHHQVGYLNLAAGGTLTQTLTDVLTAGTTYTLSVMFLSRVEPGIVEWSGSELDLLAGSTLLGRATIPAGDANMPPGSGQESTVSFTAPPGHVALGQPLTIRIATTGPFGVQILFDNVRLTAVPAVVTGPVISGITRPAASPSTQSMTITGTNFPVPPTVTVTGPNSQPVSVSVVSSSATEIVVSGVFALAGTYIVTVDDSAPFNVDTQPPIITSVVPPPQAGLLTAQTLTISGSAFRASPTVTVTGPDNQPVAVNILAESPTSLQVRGYFTAPGNYTFQVNDSLPYVIAALPFPVITHITPPTASTVSTQDLTITGTGFPASPVISVLGPNEAPINVTTVSATSTQIVVRGIFYDLGAYAFRVGVSDPFVVNAVPQPATITSIPTLYFLGPGQEEVTQAVTLLGVGFTPAPGMPVVTVTGPEGTNPVWFHVNTSQDTWISLDMKIPAPGIYTFTADGSAPFPRQTQAYVGFPTITDVDAPQSGETSEQYITITGVNFSVPPAVVVADPFGQVIPTTVIEPTTSTSILIRGVFYPHGPYQFQVDNSNFFYVTSLPPVNPVAEIHSVQRPQAGVLTPQFIAITGIRFEVPPLIRIQDPSGEFMDFTLMSSSTTSATVSGIFSQPGTYRVWVDNSLPYDVQALPQTSTITNVQRPQAGLDTTQAITITGTSFASPPMVIMTGPAGPVAITIGASTDTSVSVTLPALLPEGNYTVSVDGSPGYTVAALPIPIPTITSVTQPQSGLTSPQTLTIGGTWFRDPVTVTVTGPGGFVTTTVLSSSRTSIDISGVFLHPGTYTVSVMADGRTSLPFQVQALAPAPPTITDVQRPQAGITTAQSLTLQTTGYLTGPVVTVTGPDGLNVPVMLMSAPSAPLGGPVTVSGVFYASGTYTFSVDGSQPFSITAIPPPVITSVQRPQAGELAPQTITITGTDFPEPSTVTITDPLGNPIAVSIVSSSSTSITVSGVFYPPGTYTVRVTISQPFAVEALPPIPVITGVTRPQAGDESPQQVTITGSWFPDPATVTVTGPSGTIDVSIVSRTDTTIVVSGIFALEGSYTFTVSNSSPFTIDAIPIPPPPPPVITNVTPPQWGTQKTQYLTISGNLFRPDSVVTVHAPAGPDVPITIVDLTPTSILISGVFEREGIYAFQVDDSNIFYVEATPPPPPPFIIDVTPPQYGTTALQTVKITGTNFPGIEPDSQLIVHVIGPDGQPIDVTVISNTSDTITIWGRFPLEGPYTFQVSDGEVFSNVFTVYAMAPPAPPVVYSYPIRRVREFQLPSSPDQRRMFISRLELEMRTGIGKLHDPGPGSGMDPQVMMQLSRDGGKTWGPEQWRHAGNMGEYLRRVRWLRQGYYRNGVLRLVFSVPVPWQLTSLSGDLREGSN